MKRVAPFDGDSAKDIDFFLLGGSLLGGVCLLSYSMSVMSRSLRAAFGPSLRATIQAACYSRVTAFLTGALATAALTSATATSLLTLSFVQAGDMTLAQALGISLGINVGATLNAHLVAIQVQRYGPALLAVGYIVSTVARQELWRHVGESVLGLGLLFLSISLISEGIAPLRHYPPFLTALGHMTHAPLALSVSAACAVLFQSSNTVIAIAIMLGQQGYLSLRTALLFVLGANVGTCATSIIAALGQRREAMRVALAYLLLKAAGALLLFICMPQFVWLVDVSVGSGSGGGGSANADAVADDAVADAAAAVRTIARLPAQIANAHTFVNVVIALLFMPLLDRVADFMVVLVPGVDSTPAPALLSKRGDAGGDSGEDLPAAVPAAARGSVGRRADKARPRDSSGARASTVDIDVRVENSDAERGSVAAAVEREPTSSAQPSAAWQDAAKRGGGGGSAEGGGGALPRARRR